MAPILPPQIDDEAIERATGMAAPTKVAVKRSKRKLLSVLYLVAAPDGYRLTPYDPEFERQTEVARGVMKRRRNVLRALAR